MEQSTLKYLRILIPGMIFNLGFYPIYNTYFSDLFEIKSIDFAYVTILALIIGGIYYQLNIQRIITKPSHYCITKNIYDKLVKIYGTPLSKNDEKKLKEKNKYMNIFYNLIDKDETLKRKAANVYFNGIFWTSTADSFLLNLFFYFIYKHMATSMTRASEISKLFLILSILSIILHVISVIKHIKLSNTQFSYIETHYEIVAEVKTKINAIL